MLGITLRESVRRAPKINSRVSPQSICKQLFHLRLTLEPSLLNAVTMRRVEYGVWRSPLAFASRRAPTVLLDIRLEVHCCQFAASCQLSRGSSSEKNPGNVLPPIMVKPQTAAGRQAGRLTNARVVNVLLTLRSYRANNALDSFPLL